MAKYKFVKIIAILLLTCFANSGVLAQGKGNGKGNGKGMPNGRPFQNGGGPPGHNKMKEHPVFAQHPSETKGPPHKGGNSQPPLIVQTPPENLPPPSFPSAQYPVQDNPYPPQNQWPQVINPIPNQPTTGNNQGILISQTVDDPLSAMKQPIYNPVPPTPSHHGPIGQPNKDRTGDYDEDIYLPIDIRIS
ncbi:WAS/WASL-interacting protein family member 1 [Musca domestica]|uniref:WAS/WASL-interacting protein family member 1 n=1 Tax=Musca domestica TaxID=7370 RepID=T1P961_MUSDO|nr:WAS/WASL-interacting protein family member 1 [Musca domestica]